MPHNIITDNGMNFANGALASFCAAHGIRLDLASVSHPQSNDQVERANCLILSGDHPNGIEFDSPRVTLYTEAEAKEAREDVVDLLEEARLLELSRSAIYHQNLCPYHNKKIKPRAFREGNLVLRLIHRTVGQHKLSAPWEGPFIVSKALGNDSYYLIDEQKPRARKRDTAGQELERPWNANLLRPFYS
ncbi:uncharacterized protein [Aegilops tauschii subsp. strangulata]|uniref:uncharacterized protein n=1 Tax=Aegilops tauschii subsp. strangulata TaxID=200361 RepID=UPI003CC8CC95